MNEMVKASPVSKFWETVKHSEAKDWLAPIIGAAFFLILGNIISPGFLSSRSIISMLSLSSMLIIACVGQQFIIMTPGIDIGISAYMILGVAWGGALSGGTTLGLLKAMLLMAAIGALCGAIEGYSVTRLAVPSLVATMSMGKVLSNAYMAITHGNPVGAIAPVLKTIGMGSIGGIRWLLILGIAMTIITEMVLKKTRFGKSLYLVGANYRAARIAGINSKRIIMSCYIIAGIWGTITGFLLLGMIGAMNADMTGDYVMLTITACVVGGTSMAGGKGSFIGTAFGAIFMTLLTNVLKIADMATGLRDTLQGLILMIILCVYSRGPKLRQ